ERTDEEGPVARDGGAADSARRCDFCPAATNDAEVGGGGSGAASVEPALCASAQAPSEGGARAARLDRRDRPAVADRGDRRRRRLCLDRWLQTGARVEATGTRHGAGDRVADRRGGVAHPGVVVAKRARRCVRAGLAARGTAGAFWLLARAA